MTQVNMGDEVIETNLPADKVADLQQPAEQPQEPAKEPEKASEQPEKPADAPAEEPKTDPEPTKEPEKPRDPETGKFSRKAGPIADLLEKKHEAEQKAAQAEAKAAELEAKLQALSQQPQTAQTDDKITALAEKHGLDPEILADIVATAREGVNPSLPQEVLDLIAENKAAKQQQEELTAFNKRVDSLATTLKDDLLKDPSVREKLQALAYSTEKAPDGEPYYQKELAELYFAFIKPEAEPGKVSAEGSSSGKGGGEILDFEAIMNDEAKMEEFAKTAPSEQWKAFVKFRDEKQGDTPIIRKHM